jgi:TolA-binding protein
MAFKALQLRFIRFLGPDKEPAEFNFTSGLNILWGSSDTGKTFLVEAIDFMLGGGEELRDIPERDGYDHILLGLTTQSKDYTLHRSVNGGAFTRFDGLLADMPSPSTGGHVLSAGHDPKNYKNLSNWLLQQIGLDHKEVLYNKTKGTLKSLGFRALAHLCLIKYPTITQSKSPIFYSTQKTREYGVFKLLLSGVDDSAVTPEATVSTKLAASDDSPPLSNDAIAQVISDYDDQLTKITDNPLSLDQEQDDIEKDLEELQTSIRQMEGAISQTARERKVINERYTSLTARGIEISELQERFKLLDQQYSNDLKRLTAIKESGQFFVLRHPMPCPLCGALPEGQHHDAACDGNVEAVTQAAAAEIAKIQVLQTELRETVGALVKEGAVVRRDSETLEGELAGYQQQLDSALSPDFSQARQDYTKLIEQRAAVLQGISIRKRIEAMRRRLDEPVPPRRPEPVETEKPGEVNQYISKSVLRDFSQIVGGILSEWHFPDATDVYFDETTKDVVIAGRPRGSRGAGLCAITYSAFTVALFEYCRSRRMPHPGFVVLDSPLIAYKEPSIEDEGIAGTDLKPRFYQHLESFAGEQQIFIVDNTEPPDAFISKATHFTKNEQILRYGLFPFRRKMAAKSLAATTA